MHNNQSSTAAILVIGNEILSGRTEDKNINFLAKELKKIGVTLREVRVIRDEEAEIIKHVKDFSHQYTYVLLTGGIGPTHDDITTASVAKAFDVRLITSEEAIERIKARYREVGVTMIDTALKMAQVPEGAILITNGVSGAPGFMIKNVFVMAGVPDVMQSMFAYVKERYIKKSGEIYSRSIRMFAGESKIANELGELQNKFSDLEIGSYPFIAESGWAADLVVSGRDLKRIDECIVELKQILTTIKVEFKEA